MTHHHNNVIERVSQAIYLANGERSFGDECDKAAAQAALEASHHAELVEALRDANAYLHAADIDHPVRNRIDALLAKIGASQ